MNTLDPVSVELLIELKKMFPEIPEETIKDCINQSSKDKEECVKFLTRIKEDYLFGCQSPVGVLTVGHKFTKMSVNDDVTENNDSNELNSEDIYIPQETMNFKYPLEEEEKSTNAKQSSNQTAVGKNTIHSAPVIPSASSPFGLLDNGHFSASGQREFSSNANIVNYNHIGLSRDTSKWNENCNEVAAQLPRQNFFSRLYSYPIPDPRNIPISAFPPFYTYNHLNSEDYTKPLRISVTSSQFLNPHPSSHTSVSLLPPSSPNSQRQSPVPSHLVPAYTSPSSVLESSSSVSSNLTSSYASPVPPVLNPSSSVSCISPFHYSSAICPPHKYPSTSHSPTTVTTTELHYAYEHPVAEDQLRERIDTRKTSLHTNPFQQSYELFSKDFTSRTTYPTNLPTSFDQYNSQFTDQLSPFIHNSHGKAEGNKDTDYVKVLVAHQRKNYELIRKELLKMETLRYTLRMDVSSREEELLKIRQQQKFPNMEEIQKLKEEIMKLRVERDCLAMELDFHIRGQESSDSIEDNFYENIFTGPKGPIPPVPSSMTAQNQNIYIDRRDEDDQSNKWNCSKCTYANHPDLIDCEICESPRVMIN